MILTKKAILEGTSNIEKIELKSIEGEVFIRPLNQAEVTEYNRITAKGLGILETGKRTPNVKVDVEKTTIANFNAQAYALATSLSVKDETWTEDEVKSLDSSLFKEIFENVARISGLDTNVEEDVNNFLEGS